MPSPFLARDGAAAGTFPPVQLPVRLSDFRPESELGLRRRWTLCRRWWIWFQALGGGGDRAGEDGGAAPDQRQPAADER